MSSLGGYMSVPVCSVTVPRSLPMFFFFFRFPQYRERYTTRLLRMTVGGMEHQQLTLIIGQLTAFLTYFLPVISCSGPFYYIDFFCFSLFLFSLSIINRQLKGRINDVIHSYVDLQYSLRYDEIRPARWLIIVT